MSPVDQSAGRHWGGRGEPTGAWTCPTCGAKNAGPVGEGCGSCGAGSAAKNAEAARVAALAAAPPVDDDTLYRAVVEGVATHYTCAEQARLEGFSRAAQRTLVNALEFYLAQAQPQPGDLPTPVIRAWALKLVDWLDQLQEADQPTENT